MQVRLVFNEVTQEGAGLTDGHVDVCFHQAAVRVIHRTPV